MHSSRCLTVFSFASVSQKEKWKERKKRRGNGLPHDCRAWMIPYHGMRSASFLRHPQNRNLDSETHSSQGLNIGFCSVILSGSAVCWLRPITRTIWSHRDGRPLTASHFRIYSRSVQMDIVRSLRRYSYRSSIECFCPTIDTECSKSNAQTLGYMRNAR